MFALDRLLASDYSAVARHETPFPGRIIMNTRLPIIALIAASMLVAVSACNKDGGSATTAAKVAAPDPVALLEAGQEPRTELRYKITDGTITRSIMEFRLATLAETREGAAMSVVPGVRLNIVSGPSRRTDEGIQFSVNIDKAEAAVPEGLDPEVAADLRSSAEVLDDVGGRVQISNRGLIQSTELNERAKNPDLPVRMLMMLVNARTTLSRVMLPAEPVGIGARWESRKQLVLYGFAIEQVDTYTLVDMIGDEIKLNVTVTQTALPQSVAFPDDDVTIAVESMSSNAKGQIILNLNALESDAVASGESNDKLTVSSGDRSEKVNVTEAFDIRMTNTTRLE